MEWTCKIRKAILGVNSVNKGGGQESVGSILKASGEPALREHRLAVEQWESRLAERWEAGRQTRMAPKSRL